MHYDFIEIGTSDFDALIQSCRDDERGLSIEPIAYYLNRLPDRSNVKKICAALSDKEGEIEIYHIPDEEIQRNNLPWWVRGSNSVNHPHQHTINAIGLEVYNRLVRIDKVPTITWEKLIKENDVDSIGYLKIDTEGYDHVILKEYLKICKTHPNLLADKIRCEYYPPVSNIAETDKLLPLFKNYDIEKSEGDIVMTRRKKHEKAWVLYCNEPYLETAKACISSLNKVSKLPVYLYFVNGELPIVEGATVVPWDCEVNNVEQQAFIDRQNTDIFKLLIQRPRIVEDALLKYAETVAYVDCDSIATKNAERIFDLYPKDKEFPYFTEGIYDYMYAYGRGASSDDLNNTLEAPTCQLFNVDQSVRKKYRQTGFFVAGQNTIPFLDEWSWMCNHPLVINNHNLYAPFHEETILQVLLYKKNIHEGLPYIYINATYDDLNNIFNEWQWGTVIREWVRMPENSSDLLFIHKEKDPIIMKKMIDYLNRQSSPLKILFLEGHLSTGGAPAFCLKRLEALKKFTNIETFVVEYQFYSPDYVVHRNKIEKIADHFYSLGTDKLELFRIIQNNNIDIVHLDETVEWFVTFDGMPQDIANRLYDKHRSYKIVETCHNISFYPGDKKWNPDAYAFCTPYHEESFVFLPSYKETIEFPIERVHTGPATKTKVREKLGLDPLKKHVLNIGLWTSGKNQAEGIEIARKYPDIMFHFVGNLAGNFKNYWEPLMKVLPDNVKIWGEREDVNLFYRACDIFMFNSTFECNPVVLREAISYGLPIVAHNLPQYRGMFDGFIQPIDSDLHMLKRNYKVPVNNTVTIFGQRYYDFYQKVLSIDKPRENPLKGVTIIQYFVDNPFIEIKGESDKLFDVAFYDEQEVCHYRETIGTNHWIRLNRRYYTKWRTEIKVDGEIVYDYTLNYKGKRVFICIESPSLGDTIAWIPYVEEFRKLHQCHVIVSTFKNFLFKKAYPELEFVEPGTTVHNLHGQYRISWWYDKDREPELPHTIPLQKTASNILGLEWKEIKPKIDFIPQKRLYQFKYVAIATNSTAGCKFWVKEEWQKLVNYLVSKGYKVINVSKEKNPLDNVEQITNVSIENTMHVIHHSEFFIGLSSGLSWLAWAMDKPIVMIANFSEREHEFSCIRVTNENVCNGCWNNKNFQFDRGDYNWCPIWKNTPRQFECQKSITAEMVINALPLQE